MFCNRHVHNCNFLAFVLVPFSSLRKRDVIAFALNFLPKLPLNHVIILNLISKLNIYMTFTNDDKLGELNTCACFDLGGSYFSFLPFFLLRFMWTQNSLEIKASWFYTHSHTHTFSSFFPTTNIKRKIGINFLPNGLLKFSTLVWLIVMV